MTSTPHSQHESAPPERSTLNVQRSTRGAGLAFLFGILVTAPMALQVGAVGSRSGGSADIEYESLNAGGASYAASSIIQLGGSLGQGNLIQITTNASGGQSLNGFWKADNSCVMYEPTITAIRRGGSSNAVSFYVVNSNDYIVAYITDAQGGLKAGSDKITNVLQSFIGAGPAGSTTTIWENASSATNPARYYIIRCTP